MAGPFVITIIPARRHHHHLSLPLFDDEVRIVAGCLAQAGQGFVHGFVGEFESRMVHGQQVAGAAGDEHAPDLFRGGVHVFPGVVGADAEDGEVDLAEFVEGFGVGGVAGEEDGAFVVAEEVGVDASLAVEPGAGAPVAWREGFESGTVEIDGLAGREFDDVGEALGNEFAAARRDDDGGAFVGEPGERGLVEVVVVGVGD